MIHISYTVHILNIVTIYESVTINASICDCFLFIISINTL